MSLDQNRALRRGELYKDLYSSDTLPLEITFAKLVDGYIGGVIPKLKFSSSPFIVTEMSDGEEANVMQVLSNKPFGKLYSFGNNYISLTCGGMVLMEKIPTAIDNILIDDLMENSRILRIRFNDRVFYGWCVNQVFSFTGQPQEHCGFKFDFLCVEMTYDD